MNNKFRIAVLGSLAIAIILTLINFLTTPHLFWSFIPVIAVLWWPLAIRFASNKKIFSILGCLLIVILLIGINLIFSPRIMWSVIPALCGLWWPIAVFFGRKKNTLSIIGCLHTALLLIYINAIFSPHVIWSPIPCFVLLWWPIAVFFGKKKKILSIIGCLHIILLLLYLNLTYSPHILWAFVPCFALLWWPIATFFGRNKKTLSIIGSLHTIALITAINAIYTPSYPWAMFVVFPILWWPISIFFSEKAKTIPFSIVSAVIITAYYAMINIFVEPRHIFWIYVAYGLLWWPLSRIFYGRINRRLAAIFAIIANIAFIVFVNQRVCLDYNWSVFVFGPTLILTIMLFIGEKRKTLSFAVSSYILLMAYYGFVNYFIENRHLFIIYVAFTFAWWPISVSFARHRNLLRFSIISFLLLTAFFIGTNWVTTPDTIWAVYPISAAALWPLSMLIFCRKKGEENKLESDR